MPDLRTKVVEELARALGSTAAAETALATLGKFSLAYFPDPARSTVGQDILRMVREHPEPFIRRYAVAQRLRKDHGTTTKHVDELRRLGLVLTGIEHRSGRRGKAPVVIIDPARLDKVPDHIEITPAKGLT